MKEQRLSFYHHSCFDFFLKKEISADIKNIFIVLTVIIEPQILNKQAENTNFIFSYRKYF